VLHNGQRGLGCELGSILCRYSCSMGDLFVRNCASSLLVYLFSEQSISNGVVFMTLFMLRVFRYSCTACVCIDFMFCFTMSGVLFGEV